MTRPGLRIVLATFGSLGDLRPYLAVASGLAARGHRPVVATSAFHGPTVLRAGVDFHAVRPDLTDFGIESEWMPHAMDLRTGTEYVVRRMLMPHLGRSYEDLLAAAEGADLLVTHPLAYAGPLVAERLGLRRAGSVLAPLGFFSVHDPPVLSGLPVLTRLRTLRPGLYGALFGLLRGVVRSWAGPVHALRAELGLPRAAADPLLAGQFSPLLNLALFSEVLASPQRDWPPHTVVTGFPFHREEGDALPPELERFLDAGPPPVVFTLGTSAVMDAGDFYRTSAAAALRLGRRAVLLTGRDPRNRLTPLPGEVAVCEYAPYAELFPRAAAIVHQGGIGTTAEALRAGRPMLVVPHSHDQPDNAARVVRLGVARVLARRAYAPQRAAAGLERLLGDPGNARRAEEVGRRVRSEDGVAAACRAIEEAAG